MKIDCSTLVLDLDGTISDPSLGISRSINYALKLHGFEQVSDAAVVNEIGPPLNVAFANLAPHASSSCITELISSYRERYSVIGYSENTLYPDIPMVLNQLRVAGLRLSVCTSKRRDFAEKILDLFGLSDYFDFVDGGDVGVSKKSQLAGLLAAQMIDRKAIMVGDRSVDTLAAKANKLGSVGVLWGFGGYAELSETSPSYLIERVTQLSDLFVSP